MKNVESANKSNEGLDFIFGQSEEEIKKNNFWDDYVPIVQDGNTYTAFLAAPIEEPEMYNQLCHLLNVATEDMTIVLDINTPGGQIDSATKILHSLAKTKAHTKAVITGTVASAGTIIALSCKEMEIAKYTQFMIHNYSTGTQGKGHEVMAYIQFNDKNLKATFQEIYKGFLTDEEMDSVIKGEDMWLNDMEVLERWNKMQKA